MIFFDSTNFRLLTALSFTHILHLILLITIKMYTDNGTFIYTLNSSNTYVICTLLYVTRIPIMLHFPFLSFVQINGTYHFCSSRRILTFIVDLKINRDFSIARVVKYIDVIRYMHF